MTWKAWLEGNEYDLRTLKELFREGDPLVAEDAANEYYLETDTLQASNGQLDLRAAESVIKTLNGVARAANQSFETVRLTNRYTGPDGRTSTWISATATLHMGGSISATALVDGAPPPRRPPRGPGYIKLAEHDSDVADVLRVLGQPGPLDWYDIYKAWEIVESAVGGWRQVVARGWAAKADIERLTASANHPGISGDKARHARMPGTPGQNRAMHMSEADALVRRIIAAWVESHPSY